MEILGENPELDMRDPATRIYARNYAHPSSYIAPEAEVVNSYIAEGSTVYGKVVNSVISTGCTVGPDAEVTSSFVMPDASIGTHATIRYAIIGEGSTVEDNARVGDNPQFYDNDAFGIAVVGKDKVVLKNAAIAPKEVY